MESGARIQNALNAFIAGTDTIRPLRDQLVVEPLYNGLSSVIDVQWEGETIRGRVLAKGPGCYPKRYNGPKGQRTQSWDSKAFLPTVVKVGDIVHLGGLEIRGYLHNTFMWGGKTVVMCREADVTGVEK